jgi:hypothetical protein
LEFEMPWLLIMEFFLLVFGVVALIRGKFTISSRRVVEGVPARVLGLVAIIPLPLFILGGIVLGILKGDKAAQFFEKNKSIFVAIELVGVAIAFAVVFGIGAVIGQPLKKKKRKEKKKYRDHEEDACEEDEDVRPRRRSRQSDEDEEDDRPRSSRRYEEDEDEDDRPRRRREDR